MIRFRRREHPMPELNTSSLPDLIFSVLFFFIIVTHMREDTLHVKYAVPQGTQLQKTAKKSAVVHIYIGRQLSAQGKAGKDAPIRVQLDDKVIPIEQIPDYIMQHRSQLQPEDQKKFTVNVSADRNTDMQTVMAVKSELRRSGALKVMFVGENKAKEKEKKNKK